MPTTSRIVVHAGNDGKGASNVLSYITDDEKTDHGSLNTGFNCNPLFAVEEFEANVRKFHKQSDERVAYHIIQSFSADDPITAKEANEIGLKLCKELYPRYQCVVATHIDRGHIHNHIVVNAVNLDGKKLEDRLANKTEGLYGLRTASDQIARKYGCKIIEDAPPIGRYKSKNYDRRNQFTGKQELLEKNKNASSWKAIIIDQIENLKTTCSTLDELLHGLALEGYEIKRGKYISVKPFGKDRFVRLEKITKDKGYSEESLRQFFKDKREGTFVRKLKTYKISNSTNLYVNDLYKIASKSREAIELSSNEDQLKMTNYPIYHTSRYKELKRYEALCKSMDLLNEEHIYSYEDLMKRISSLQEEIIEREAEYTKQCVLAQNFMDKEEVCNTYLKTYNDYLRYAEQCKQNSFENIVPSESVTAHLAAKEILNNAEIDEVREFSAAIFKERREANKQYAYIRYLHSKMTDLERLRGKSLEMQGFIKGMSFSENMIDDKRSNDTYYCVKLPYTNQYVYLQKNCVAWDVYEQRAIMYLVDDKKYSMYDEYNNKIAEVSGNDLETISMNRKIELDEYYRSH